MNDFIYDHDEEERVLKRVEAKEICTVCHKPLTPETIYCEEDMSAVCSPSCLQIAYYSGGYDRREFDEDEVDFSSYLASRPY